MSFKKKKYQVIRKAISKDMADLCYRYLAINYNADAHLINNNITHENSIFVGNYKDAQVPNSYAKYGDRLMESLLLHTIPIMQKKTGLKLIPTYSYCRLYKKGNVLRKHKDRPSCEISTTLNLGGDDWAIYLDPTGADTVIDEYKSIHKPNSPKGIKVDLKQGDMLIYSGCELEHRRDEFKGNVCGQVFLHYNHADGQFKETNKYDGRPMLGIPKNA